MTDQPGSMLQESDKALLTQARDLMNLLGNQVWADHPDMTREQIDQGTRFDVAALALTEVLVHA